VTACGAVCDLSATLLPPTLDPEHVALGRSDESIVSLRPDRSAMVRGHGSGL
jgi:hypothetical protein